ncbi:MAG: TRAP transporter small permease [Rhodospirillaceae bacterium]|nr:TRAP transporter small permease [Rhodospirillaceae bacterium]
MNEPPKTATAPAVSAFDRAVDLVVAVAAIAAGLLLLFIAGLVTIDVLGRLPGRLAGTWLFTSVIPALFGPVDANRWGFTLPWTTEVSEYALYGMTFLGAPWVLREGGHIFIDIVLQRLGPGTRAIVTRITALIGVAICAVLLGYGIVVLTQAVREGTQIVQALTVREWWILAPVPVSALLLMLVFLRWLFRPASRPEAAPEGL